MDADVVLMLSTLAEILFLENSRPLHRQLLALLRPLPEPHAAVLGRAICSRVAALATAQLPEGWAGTEAEEEAEGKDGTPKAAPESVAAGAAASGKGEAGSSEDGAAGSRAAGSLLLLGQALTSLLGLPAVRAFLAPCAAPAVACVSIGIQRVLSGTSVAAPSGAEVGAAESAEPGAAAAGEAALHIPPAVMEDVQDAGESGMSKGRLSFLRMVGKIVLARAQLGRSLPAIHLLTGRPARKGAIGLVGLTS